MKSNLEHNNFEQSTKILNYSNTIMNSEKFKRKVPAIAVLCVAMLAMILPARALAYDFRVGSIYYNKTSDSEVEVTSPQGDNYRGDKYIIPETVTYNDVVYTVTSIGLNAFAYCSSLKSIEIPNSVTSIGSYSFLSCTLLTSIEIPNSVTSIGYSAFARCYGLTSIEIPNSVTSIGSYAFERCNGLKSIEIPNSVTSIGGGTFSNCTSLKSIEIPNSVTSIGREVFRGCTSLKSIEIPNSVMSIEYAAFYGCSSLTSVKIPGSVTSIEKQAFCECKSLTSIEIPGSVTSIKDEAFKYCNSLASVTLFAPTPPTLGTDVFTYTSSSKTLYVPVSSLEVYRYSSWDDVFTDIQPILSALTIESQGNGKVYIGGEEVVNGAKYIMGTLNLFVLADDGYQIASATIGDKEVKHQIVNHILTVDNCEDAGAIKVVFAPENETLLTVKGHESHSLTHYYKEGTQAKIDLSPSAGWELYSLAFNGENVMNDIEDNTYTTPALSGANNLEVVMKSSVATDTETIEIQQRTIKFRKYGNTVEILNLEEGESISIYNSDGTCEYQGDKHIITLNTNNVYILRTQSEVLKFAL